MSLLNDQLVDIRLHYLHKETKYGSKQLIILEDEKAEEMLQDEERAKQVEILNTRWASLSWAEQNDLMRKTQGSVATGEAATPSFDWIAYQQIRVLKCLREWDLVDDGKTAIPVTENNINKLPAVIVRALLDRYDDINTLSEEEEKKL